MANTNAHFGHHMALLPARASDERLPWSRALPVIAALSTGLWGCVALAAWRLLS